MGKITTYEFDLFMAEFVHEIAGFVRHPDTFPDNERSVRKLRELEERAQAVFGLDPIDVNAYLVWYIENLSGRISPEPDH